MAQATRNLQPGDTIGSYTVKRQIGKGGMGVVYEVTRNADGETFAIKSLTLVDNKRDREFVRRFLREARLAAAINHPNVVKVVGFIQREREYFIVMEYFPQGSVKDLLQRSKRLPQDKVIHIGIAVANALAEAAKIHIVHRDIKPDNIMLANDGTPRLADLGLATMMHNDDFFGGITATGDENTLEAVNGENFEFSLTLSHMAMGTPAYMSPEQACDSRMVDGRADIYSLGATLYHLLCGCPPFSGHNVKEILAHHQRSPVPDIFQHCPDVPPELAKIVYKCMEKSPDNRYQTPEELLAALERLEKPAVKNKETPPPQIHENHEIHEIKADIPAERAPASPSRFREMFSAVGRGWQRLTTRENLVLILEILIALVFMAFIYYFSRKK